MTRAGLKRRRMRKQRRMQVIAWVILDVGIGFLAMIPTAVIAMILVTLEMGIRGYFAVGGEWLMILMVFCYAYYVIRDGLCDRFLKKKGGGENGVL